MDQLRNLASEEGTQAYQPDDLDYQIPIAVVLIGNMLFGIFCQMLGDNSWIDVWWGWTFVFPNLALIIKKILLGYAIGLRVLIVFSLVTVWALRLSVHIGLRHKGEDWRYQEFRRAWTEEGLYYVKTFVFIFGMQGLFSLIANAAPLYVTVYSQGDELIWLDYVGIAVWLFGFIFEWVGDE